MSKSVLLFVGFYLTFGTNYFNDNDWILAINQGWPFDVCQSNSVSFSVALPGIPDSKYIEYTCNNDGSVTKSNYASISADGECMDIQSSINYPNNFTNPSDLYGFECNSTNKYVEINFFGYFFSDPPSNQCTASALGKGTFKFSVDSCASNDGTSFMFTCSPGVITATTYNGPTCDSSSILEVVSINEGICTKYLDGVAELNGAPVSTFIYATYGSCNLAVPTAAPTLTPSLSPTISVSPTNAPSNIPSITPTDIPTDTPSNKPSDTPTGIPTGIPTDIPTDIPSSSPTTEPTNTPTEFMTNYSTGNLHIPCIFSLIFTINISVLIVFNVSF